MKGEKTEEQHQGRRGKRRKTGEPRGELGCQAAMAKQYEICRDQVILVNTAGHWAFEQDQFM